MSKRVPPIPGTAWLAFGLACLLADIATAQEPARSAPSIQLIQSANSSQVIWTRSKPDPANPREVPEALAQLRPVDQGVADPPSTSSPPGSGVPAESRLGQFEAQAGEPVNKLGPTPAPDVKILQNRLRELSHAPVVYDPITGKAQEPSIRVYGWLDMGYTYSSSGSGRLAVEPRPNRYGDEFLLNQLSITIEKALVPNEFSWGFVIHPYTGADAALLNPIRGAMIPNPDPRFGLDFRDLYVQAHLPILTEGGTDIEFGQHYPLIGYQSAMAPFRTFYSNDYQWFYGEAGSFTGLIFTTHVNKQLDIVNAITAGYVEFFTMLSVSPTYMGRIDYWLQAEKKTLVSLGVVTGPASAHSGDMSTLVDLTVTHNWNKRLTQVVQFGAGYSKNGIFLPGLERYYGLYNMFLYHVTPELDVNFRTEWYDDVDGRSYPGGTGFRNNYEEITLGIDYHPVRWLQVRPELRADFANDTPAFGPVSGVKRRSQFTPAIELLMKF